MSLTTKLTHQFNCPVGSYSGRLLIKKQLFSCAELSRSAYLMLFYLVELIWSFWHEGQTVLTLKDDYLKRCCEYLPGPSFPTSVNSGTQELDHQVHNQHSNIYCSFTEIKKRGKGISVRPYMKFIFQYKMRSRWFSELIKMNNINDKEQLCLESLHKQKKEVRPSLVGCSFRFPNVYIQGPKLNLADTQQGELLTLLSQCWLLFFWNKAVIFSSCLLPS